MNRTSSRRITRQDFPLRSAVALTSGFETRALRLLDLDMTSHRW